MSKEEAIEILSEMRSEYNLFGDEEEATRYHVLSWAIKEMNAEPVKRGKWDCECEDDMFEYAICSCCKWDSGEAWEYAKKRFRYCPNCGAKMEVDG